MKMNFYRIHLLLINLQVHQISISKTPKKELFFNFPNDLLLVSIGRINSGNININQKFPLIQTIHVNELHHPFDFLHQPNDYPYHLFLIDRIPVLPTQDYQHQSRKIVLIHLIVVIVY
jgi:hypothetical protein